MANQRVVFVPCTTEDRLLVASCRALEHLFDVRPDLDVAVVVSSPAAAEALLAELMGRFSDSLRFVVNKPTSLRPQNLIQLRHRFARGYIAAELLVVLDGWVSDAALQRVPAADQGLVFHRTWGSPPETAGLPFLGPRRPWPEVPLEVLLAGGGE